MAALKERPNSFVEVLRLDRGKWYRATIMVHLEKKVAMVDVAGVTIITAEIPPEGLLTESPAGTWDVIIGDPSHLLP
ncbi:MAG: hypothetical protein DRJ56_06275 [Thermoprotei archaeon]|nr:MAG: hypothetical protein DRJ56_06275 [Thermoprotei archaeon]